jgi:cell division protein FtsW (lipid II flippase)
MVLFGLLMVYSASFIFAEERTGDGFLYIKKQVLYAAMGFGAFYVASRVPHQRWYQWAPVALFTVLTLLVLVMVPGVGARSGGAQRWINLGVFRFQPGELAKLVGVMFVGRQLVRHQRDLYDFRKGVIAPVALLVPVMVLLLLQRRLNLHLLLALLLSRRSLLLLARPLLLHKLYNLDVILHSHVPLIGLIRHYRATRHQCTLLRSLNKHWKELRSAWIARARELHKILHCPG